MNIMLTFYKSDVGLSNKYFLTGQNEVVIAEKRITEVDEEKA